MKVSKLPTLLRTLWYVPPQQLLARIVARCKRVYYQTPLYPLLLENVTEAPEQVLPAPVVFAGNAERGKLLADKGEFTFVGRTIVMKETVRWLPHEVSHLWQFNLHYWDWLADLKAANRRDEAQKLVEDWLLNCDQYQPTVWHPYPTSLRLVNALQYGKWLLVGANENLVEAYWGSLQRQASYLAANLEWDLGGNHLLKNIKALIFAGLSLSGRQSLFLEGQKLLLEQLKIQILPDGSHYERSPMYHMQVLMDLLDIQALIRKSKLKVAPQLTEAIDRMGEALAFYRYPDGGLGLFSDSAVGDIELLDMVAKKSGAPKKVAAELIHGGYVRLDRKKMMVMLDAGRVGPDAIPGHAHAQTLSIEACYAGQRLFVNSGTYAYQHSKRHMLRSTAAHSTVEVDEENSAEVWAAFRVGRRPRVVTREVSGRPGGSVKVEAAHDGYRHLHVQHARSLELNKEGTVLKGLDVLSSTKGKKSHRIRAFFHVHPDVKCHLKSEQEAQLTLPSGEVLVFKTEGGRLYTKDGFYAPQFGESAINTQLIVQGYWRDGCRLTWSLTLQE